MINIEIVLYCICNWFYLKFHCYFIHWHKVIEYNRVDAPIFKLNVRMCACRHLNKCKFPVFVCVSRHEPVGIMMNHENLVEESALWKNEYRRKMSNQCCNTCSFLHDSFCDLILIFFHTGVYTFVLFFFFINVFGFSEQMLSIVLNMRHNVRENT